MQQGRPIPTPEDAGEAADGAPDGATDAVVGGPLQLRFESIALEGTPRAITDFAFVPGTQEFLLLEKGMGDARYGARVLHYLLEGKTARLLGSFGLPSSYDYHDCGLISVAFDPDFQANHLVYFAYCDSHDFSVVSRHLFDSTNYDSIEQSAAQVLRVGQENAPNAWHNVGDIGFDRDGNLWALFGEKNDAQQAQDPSTGLGSVVRVKPRRSAEAGYEQVPSNPFVGQPGRDPNVVAYGLRSPWRGTLDRWGRLWIGDVGLEEFEEINVLGSWVGTNFGWPLLSGPCEKDCSGLADPVVFWTHDLNTWPALEDPDAEPTARRVPWVGLEYVAGDNDRYEGRFDRRVLYGDFCGGWVRAIELDQDGQVRYDGHAGHLAGATGWAQADDGYVYATTYGNCFTGPYRAGGFYRALLAQ